jgi:hypothetical protein
VLYVHEMAHEVAVVHEAAVQHDAFAVDEEVESLDSSARPPAAQANHHEQ